MLEELEGPPIDYDRSKTLVMLRLTNRFAEVKREFLLIQFAQSAHPSHCPTFIHVILFHFSDLSDVFPQHPLMLHHSGNQTHALNRSNTQPATTPASKKTGSKPNDTF